MAKIKKKGTSGQAKNFITRTQAIRKLQVSLPDFRRLCIYKGIYPREPRNKKKASKTSTPSTTFYYTKDIQYLLHEPILNKFRDHKALAKKIAKSLGRGEVGDAARLEKTAKPRISLDHIIKERYPTFVDALRDLDDALSLLFLFANLPSTSTVPPKTISLCQRLCLEFEHYLIVTHSLRKSFISIKGIYYQATIRGQDILWLIPHKFVQRVTGDVDFRIMGTFVEFYTTLLGFVNFRLYTSIGLVYPPKFDVKSDEMGGELGALTLEGSGVEGNAVIEDRTNGDTKQENEDLQQNQNATIQRHADELARNTPDQSQEQAGDAAQEEVPSDTIDVFVPQAPDADTLLQPSQIENIASTLFAPYSFFLSRETPRQPLEFILKAFGCRLVSWDEVLGDGAYTNDMYDPSITHQVVDRPSLPQLNNLSNGDSHETSTDVTKLAGQGRMPGRTYIQPQWVWDCINQGKLLRPDLYAPGATLPPHLSPWVKPSKTAYDPTAPLEEVGSEEDLDEEGGKNGEEEEEDVEDAELAGQNMLGANGDVEEHGMDIANDVSSSDVASDVDAFGGFESQEEVEPAMDEEAQPEDGNDQYQRELEAEAAGLTYTDSASKQSNGSSLHAPNTKKDEKKKQAARKQREEAEELERRMMMMSKKKRKLYEKMAYSNKEKDEEARRLKGKRRKLERGKVPS
ncbi:MAG: hypothetical protein Q9220_007239 [cf. Caloplaca sp. 1 TL-2023]